MTIRQVFHLLSLASFSCLSYAQPLNPRPVKALGVPRLSATQANPGALDSVNPNYIDARDLYNPVAVALDFSSSPPSVYVADATNNRVLGWRYASQLANGAPADIVVGQRDFLSTLPQGPGGLTIGLNSPSGITVDKAGNLYVADTANNRVLRFPQPFLQPDVLKTPDLVIGQTGFAGSAANPLGITASSLFLYATQNGLPQIGLALNAAGDLFVSDNGNNRVLRYSAASLAAGSNGPPANLVLGQTQYITNLNSNGQRDSKTRLTNPLGLAFDSAGRLYVADSNLRVLIYTPEFILGGAAARILGVATQVDGQPAPAAVGAVSLGFVNSVTIGPGDRPVVVDSTNNRVLIYDSFDKFPPETSAFSPAATALIGQISFSGRSPNLGQLFPSAASLLLPFGAAASGNELYIADTGNNRVLTFPFPANGPSPTATRVLGQLNFSFYSPNLVEGREFYLSADGSTGSIVIDRNSNPPHLYVADPGNNRILGFSDFNNAKTGGFADLVIGQQNLFNTNFNNTTNNPILPSSTGLSRPTALALDAAGNLFVADTGNSRVLRFPQPFAQQNRTDQVADLVIGQANFTSAVTSATNRTVQSPAGVAVTSDGSLLVADVVLNRVLLFQSPLANGMTAVKVLGQSDFTSPASTSTPPATFDPSRFSGPRQIAVDPQDRVYVCDTGNRRIVIFDSIRNLAATLPAPALSLTQNLNQPVAITIGAAGTANAGQLWVSDFGANSVLHYPPFTQLLLNANPDITVGAFRPLAAAFDSFGDLALADFANRILLFVPQLTITNASSFTTGPVAPGTIISVFPAASATPAPIATQTGNFNDSASPLPLPVTLGDVQVLVNGAPAPLFYVSPTQINLPLPATLPTSGTVDLQIVSKSSSRIFGLTEVSLSSVSPGLFTLAGNGQGQLAALNSADNSVNTASRPLVRGQYITLFGTGQGLVANGPADGMPASGITPTSDQPRVVIGGIDVQNSDIQYSGLAPGLIGVWQLNVRVPQEVTAGNQVSVVVYLRSVQSQLRTYISLR